MESKISTARRRVESLYGDASSGDPAAYFVDLLDYDKETPLVPYSRVSGRQQKSNGNLARRMKHLAAAVKCLGFKNVIGNFGEQAAGWSDDRERLIAASELAIRHGGIVVTHSSDRFLRSQFYKSTNPVLPNNHEYQQLMEVTGGAVLATLWSADLSPQDIKAREQVFRKHDHGYRYGEKDKQRLLPLLIEGQNQGLSYRELAIVYGPSHQTIKRWLKNCNTPL